MTPKEGIIPPGGFVFDENGTRIEGHSYQSLAENLLRYRIDNRLPVGDPLKEIVERVCAQHPHFCSAHTPPLQGALPSLAGHVAGWMSRLYASLRASNIEHAFVGQEEAQRRAEICAGCPNNVNWKTGCGSCASATENEGFTFRAGRRTVGEERLQGCHIVGQENRTAVWLKSPPPVTPAEREAFPTHCWRK